MFKLFTERARRVVFYAVDAVTRLGGNVITPQHLLLGILRAEPEIIGGSRSDPNDLDQLTDFLETALQSKVRAAAPFGFPPSASLTEVFHIAGEEAAKWGGPETEVGHLVLALLQVDDPARRLLEEHGVTAAAVRKRMDEIPG